MNSYFIELEGNIAKEVEQPASYVKKHFLVTKSVRQATIIMTACGVYEGYLDGRKLGKQLLTPGYTDYNYRLQYQTYDVTEALTVGEHEITAVIGDGWYRGCIDIGSNRNSYGEKTKFLCLLNIQYEDKTTEEFHTDESWLVTQDGPLRENNLKTIERYDATINLPKEALWHAAQPSEYRGQLIPQEGELILEHEHFTPQVIHTPDGNTVLDMGQNFAGHLHFTVTADQAHAGRAITLTMGECLDENGNFTLKNLSAEGAKSMSGAVGQKLEYVLKEGRQEYKSYFLISGFQYVLVENWPEEVKGENFEGIAIYSDIKFGGNFTCSNPLINKLVENVRWSQKSNFCDIPADCPTRERSGWSADMSVFTKTACYMSDPRKFLKKWLRDYVLEQWADGNLPYVIPCAGKPSGRCGCMGWSSSIANIAETLYLFYGDKEDLEEVYDCCKRFVDFNVERAKKKNRLLFFKRGAHRRFIIETGFHYGEWLEPGRPMYKDFIKAMILPDTEFTTAWFYTLVCQTGHMATILGKTDDAENLNKLGVSIKDAYHKEFLKNGRVVSKRQCRYVRPVAHGLMEAGSPMASDTVARLNQMCIDQGYRIGTGFNTTWKILDVLSDYGYVDTAYRLLENTQQPGWLYAVTKGATTTWENWYGLDENNVPVDSHNHFAPGAVVSWLYEYCAGIRILEPGFKKVRIEPIPGGTLEYANASVETVKGRISSSWKTDGNQFLLTVELPSDVMAEVCLPDKSIFSVCGGHHTFSCEWRRNEIEHEDSKSGSSFS